MSGFSNTPDVQPNELQSVIDAQAAAISGYKRDGAGLWLLIYGEASNAAQALDLNDGALAAEYAGLFNRVFFVDRMGRAGELRLIKARNDSHRP